MLAREIYAALDAISPFASQESWDNSGLALDNKGPCEQLVLAVDADDDLVDNLPPNSCLLIHHPLIFRGLKSLASGHEARLLLKLAAKNCALICAHTNFDKSHLNRYLCEQILGLQVLYQEDFVLFCQNDFASLSELATHCKIALGLGNIRAVYARDFAMRLGDLPQCKIAAPQNRAKFSDLPLAICCGAGASMAPELYGKAAAYLTGDVKYHEALAAKLNGLNMLDITHFASEKCFAHAAAAALESLPIKATIAAFLNPFADI